MDEDKEITLEQAAEKVEMDEKILRYLDTHTDIRVALEHEILKQEFHSAVEKEISKAIETDAIQINTVEDLCRLIETDLLLMESL